MADFLVKSSVFNISIELHQTRGKVLLCNLVIVQCVNTVLAEFVEGVHMPCSPALVWEQEQIE